MRAGRALVGVAAIGYVALYVFVALRRMPYPFELEWLEGGTLDHVRRLLEGRALYGPPSTEFVAYIYPPLYYYVAAAAAKALGTSFLPLRLVSFAASLGSLALIFDLVRKETGRAFPGLVAAGLFAATFRASGFWFDLGRVDSLFLLLLLAAIRIARFGRSGAACILAAACIGLAFLTKQSALLLAVALGAHEALRDRRRGALFLLVALGLMGGTTLALEWVHGGWYSYYVFRSHPLVAGPVLRFWIRDLAGGMPVAVVAAVGYLLSPSGTGPSPARRFYAFALGALVMTSFFGRLIVGGYLNALIPAHATLAILSGLAVHQALEWRRSLPPAAATSIESLVHVACLVQLAALAYDPAARIPSAADRAAGERLVATIAGVQGEVLVPFHPYLLPLAGRRPHAHYMAVDEILQFAHGREGDRLAGEIRESFRERRYAAVVLDKAFSFEDDVKARYRLARLLFEDPDVFLPRTGAALRPEALYVPAAEVPAP
jgi:hypothetical protein